MVRLGSHGSQHICNGALECHPLCPGGQRIGEGKPRLLMKGTKRGDLRGERERERAREESVQSIISNSGCLGAATAMCGSKPFCGLPSPAWASEEPGGSMLKKLVTV